MDSISDSPRDRFETLRTFGWLFITLSLIASLSKPGATHDEWYHISNIFCKQPQSGEYCRFDRSNLYPRLFYSVVGTIAREHEEHYVLLARIFSALIISLALGFLWSQLPYRYRTALILVIVTVFPATGYFLFGSINPSSWTAVGVGTGWLGIHAALSPLAVTSKQRVRLILSGLFLLTMAVGSRWDALPFIALIAWLVLIHLLVLYYPAASRILTGVSVGAAVVLLSLLEAFSQIRPLFFIDKLFSFPEGEPDNIAFFTHYALEGLPNALFSLGSVPTMSRVIIPKVVFIAGVSILGIFVMISINRKNRAQLTGAVALIVALTVVIMAQVAAIDNRDPFGLEPRYSYPLLIVLVGWWFLLAPLDNADRVSRYMRFAIIVNVFMFAVTFFTVAEFFVDRQTFGLRILPEAPDQWWWPWLPTGPNVVLIVAVYSQWKFLSSLCGSLTRSNLAVYGE